MCERLFLSQDDRFAMGYLEAYTGNIEMAFDHSAEDPWLNQQDARIGFLQETLKFDRVDSRFGSHGGQDLRSVQSMPGCEQ